MKGRRQMQAMTDTPATITNQSTTYSPICLTISKRPAPFGLLLLPSGSLSRRECYKREGVPVGCEEAVSSFAGVVLDECNDDKSPQPPVLLECCSRLSCSSLMESIRAPKTPLAPNAAGREILSCFSKSAITFETNSKFLLVVASWLLESDSAMTASEKVMPRT